MVVDKMRIYAALDKLPKAPEGAEDFLKKLHPDFFRKNHLIYKCDKAKKSVICHCTACGSKFFMPYVEASCGCHCGTHSLPKHFGFENFEFNENVYSNQTTKCPLCSEGVVALHISDIGNDYEDFRVQFIKVYIIDRMLLVVRWTYCRYLRKDGTYISTFNPLEANIFCKDFNVYATHFCNTYNCYSGFKPFFYNRWFINSKYKNITSCCASHVMPVTEQELSFCDFPNCKLDVYLRESDSNNFCYLSSYLKIYRKYSHIENLVTNGAVYLLNSIFAFTHTLSVFRDIVDVKSKSPFSMLHLDKNEYNTMVRHCQIEFRSLEFYVRNKQKFPMDLFLSYEPNYCISDLNLLENYSYGFLKPLRYLEAQERKFENVYSIHFLTDYWDMMQKLEVKKYNPFPQNLQAAHDKATKALLILKNKEDLCKYKARFAALSKYCFEYKNLIIFPCSSDDELYIEGEQLDHCVYGYADKYINGKTALFFIRHKDKPYEPFYTLEFDEKNCSILQNHGYKNELYNPKDKSVIEFEKVWLAFAKKVKEKKVCKTKK